MSEAVHCAQIDRRSKISPQEFRREYLYPRKPVVITDATENWTARSQWTLHYFKSRYGSTLVTVYRAEENSYRADHVETVRLADFITAIEARDFAGYPYYIRDDWRLFIHHKELLADYKIPEYFFDWFVLLPSFMRLVYPRIFIGPKGAVTPLHLDIWETHAWLAQLVGRKRWILFPPEQRPLLYDYKVQPRNPDLQNFPLFRNTKPLECTIGPGDVIFVPSGWAHEVVSLDATISITHNYMGPGCFWTGLINSVRVQVLNRLRERLSRLNDQAERVT